MLNINNDIRKIVIILVSGLIGILGIWLIFTFIPFSEVIARFKYAKYYHILGYIVASFGIMVSMTLRWKYIIKKQLHDVSFWKLFWYKLTGYGVSFLTPFSKVGGEPVRGLMLKKHDIKTEDGMTSVLIDKTVEIVSNFFFFIIISISLIFVFPLPIKLKIVLAFFTILLAILSILFVYQMMNKGHFFLLFFKILKLNKVKKLKRIETLLEKYEKLMSNFYIHHKKGFLMVVFYSILAWGFSLLEFKFATLILGFNMGFSEIFLIFSAVGLAYIFPLPMALGSLEGMQIFVFYLLNASVAAGIGIAFITRLRDIVWAGSGLVYLSYFGLSIAKFAKRGFEPYRNENNVLIFDIKKK